MSIFSSPHTLRLLLCPTAQIGTFEGGSALWIAEQLLLHPNSILICIDLWNGGPDLAPQGHIDTSGSEVREG